MLSTKTFFSKKTDECENIRMARALYRRIPGLGLDLVCASVRKPHLDQPFEFIGENSGISYIAEGTNHYRFNGKDVYFPTGTVFANFRNELIGEPRDAEYPSTRYFVSIRGEGAENLLLATGFSPENRSIQLPMDSPVPALLHEMFADFLAHPGKNPLFALQRFFRVLDNIRCCFMEESFAPSLTICERIQELFEEEDFRRLGSGEIARLLGVSPRKLLYGVRAECHLSVAAFLNQLRIKLACRLLRETDCKLAFIAPTCGFSNERYFMTRFREAMGLSPSEYRKTMFNL